MAYEMRNTWNCREKLLFTREIGGLRPGIPLFGGVSFPKAMLKSQVSENKQQRIPYYQKDIKGHFGCVNAIEFSGNQDFLASGGDDTRVLIWKPAELLTMAKPKAEVMKAKHDSNIFCLAFTSDTEKVISSGNDHTVLIHSVSTSEPLDAYILEESVYSISVHPDTDSIFVTACEDGRVQLWDQRLPSSADAVVVASNNSAFQSASFNPAEGRLIATANSRDGAQLWDVRKPKWCVKRYDVAMSGLVDSTSTGQRETCMCVRWDSRGQRLLALRRRMMPVLFHISSSRPVAYFDHPGYYNGCTMKSCCFAGVDDEYAVSGSDNFNIYVWPMPTTTIEEGTKPITIKGVAWELKGHRSIVNQVQYSKNHQIFASSGVEKIVKLWSPWPMPDGRAGGQPRALYTREEYLNMIVGDGIPLPALGDNHDSMEATEEDPKMLAYFDSMVFREIENSSSSSEDSSDESFAEQTLRFLVEADVSASSHSGGTGRRRRETGRAGLVRAANGEQYSNEVVESDSSSSPSNPIINLDFGSDNDSTLSGMNDNSLLDSDDDSILSNDVRWTSDPEDERRRCGLRYGPFNDNQHDNPEGTTEENGPSFRDTLDPALGYMPTVRTSFERDVTRLVMRKRQRLGQGNKRRRVCSDPVLPRHSNTGQRPNNDINDLSGEEARERVEAAMASCRRGRSNVALRRLVQESTDGSTSDENENGNQQVETTAARGHSTLHTTTASGDPFLHSATSSGDQMDGSFSSGNCSAAHTSTQNGPGAQDSGAQTFKKRQRPDSVDNHSTGTNAKRGRHYRRQRRLSNASSGSADEEDSDDALLD